MRAKGVILRSGTGFSGAEREIVVSTGAQASVAIEAGNGSVTAANRCHPSKVSAGASVAGS